MGTVDTVDTAPELVADVVAMTRQAALDGLPLSVVLDDLRLVLHLETGDVLPLDALRACALEWAKACTSPGRAGDLAVTLDELETHVWGLLAGSPDHLPGRVVVVRPEPSSEVARRSSDLSVLAEADLLRVAARVLGQVFDRPGEHVALLRASVHAPADRAVALVPDPGPGGEPEADGGDLDRLALVRASLASTSVAAGARWVVEEHLLRGHPDGVAARLRTVLPPT
ncbi:hypothetical protein GCM10023339_20230 [Alloalcanivorax gelatiniphagus]